MPRNPMMLPLWFTPPDGCSRTFWKSSPDPPQPDPAVGQAATANVEVSREALAFSREQWEEGRPRRELEMDIARRVSDISIDQLIKQGEISDTYFDHLTSTFLPLEQEIVADARAYDTPARREEEAGRAVADVRTQFGVSRENAQREAARFGLSPVQANARYGVEMDAAEAAAAAGAANAARRGVEQIGFARRMDAASLGRNLPSAQATAASVGTQAGNAGVGAAMAPGQAARADQAAQLAGYGTAIRGFDSAGSLLNQQYNAAIHGYGVGEQAAATQSAGIGTAVGTIAGAALFF
jgi:hypothetical protein